MEIVLYYNKSEFNKLIKDIEEVEVLDGEFRDSVSVCKPKIMIQLDEYKEFNYLYIGNLNRYYFVNNIICVRNNIYMLECSVDVLMSYSDNILNQTAFISRSVNMYDSELYDDKFINNVKKEVYDEAIVPDRLHGEILLRSYGIGEGSVINCVLSMVSKARYQMYE